MASYFSVFYFISSVFHIYISFPAIAETNDSKNIFKTCVGCLLETHFCELKIEWQQNTNTKAIHNCFSVVINYSIYLEHKYVLLSIKESTTWSNF